MKYELPGRKILKRKINENMKTIKLAIGAITVLIALFFFGANGNNGEDMEILPNQEIKLNITEGDIGVIGEEKPDEIVEKSEEQKLIESFNGEIILCDISGAIINPGVYELKEGDRLKDIINLAGGLTEDADIEIINRARIIFDGEKIYIPRMAEREDDDILGLINKEANNVNIEPASSKININTAGLDELQSIPGIGPVTAQKIIDYRYTTGKFKSIEELKNISGIGEKTYKKMEEYVTV